MINPLLQTLPKRPYSNYMEFVQIRREKHGKHFGVVLKYPCLYCDGYYRIVAPWERPDPVEGYKMADRIDCPHCAKGESNEAVYKKHYKKIIAEWKDKYQKAKAARKIQKSAFVKIKKYLSKEELKAVGFGVLWK